MKAIRLKKSAGHQSQCPDRQAIALFVPKSRPQSAVVGRGASRHVKTCKTERSNLVSSSLLTSRESESLQQVTTSKLSGTVHFVGWFVTGRAITLRRPGTRLGYDYYGRRWWITQTVLECRGPFAPVLVGTVATVTSGKPLTTNREEP